MELEMNPPRRRRQQQQQHDGKLDAVFHTYLLCLLLVSSSVLLMLLNSSIMLMSSSSSSAAAAAASTSATGTAVFFVTGLSLDMQQHQQVNTNTNKQRRLRPIVVLSSNPKKQNGEVSGFLYGKLQRATSLYGSGLIGPATAVTNSATDRQDCLLDQEPLPQQSPSSTTPTTKKKKNENGKDNDHCSPGPVQLAKLNTLLWQQFGMSNCEGSVEREDILWTGPAYMQPTLASLVDTVVFLDVTKASQMETNSKDSSKTSKTLSPAVLAERVEGLWSGFVSAFRKTTTTTETTKPQQQAPEPEVVVVDTTTRSTANTTDEDDENPTDAAEIEKTSSSSRRDRCWLDATLIRSLLAGDDPAGRKKNTAQHVYIVCDSDDTEYCYHTLVGSSGLDLGRITLVAPEEGIQLGTPSDKTWTSLRPQDLDGELSVPITVRNGSRDYISASSSSSSVVVEAKKNENDEDVGDPVAATTAKSRKRRIAAAQDTALTAHITTTKKKPPTTLPTRTTVTETDTTAVEAVSTTLASTAGASSSSSSTVSHYADDDDETAVQSLSRHDLAEVCVQFALRLTDTTDTDIDINSSTNPRRSTRKMRIVRVSTLDPTRNRPAAGGAAGAEIQTNRNHPGGGDPPPPHETVTTARPNTDYFTRMAASSGGGGKIAIVNSVDWVQTFHCFVEEGYHGEEAGGASRNHETARTPNDGVVQVKSFPKRPDII